MTQLVEPGEGRFLRLGGLGVRFLFVSPPGTGVTIVEHPLEPRAMGSPVHTHGDEDEYSFVLEGELGVQVGDEVFTASVGTFIAKPRGVPHAFWNAGDTPARLLEVISPGGFERYWEEIAESFPASGPPGPDAIAKVASAAPKYNLHMDIASVPRLVQEYGLVLG
jgi:quercetin dioxygenase-like cupin family protein